jgi:hypothetical protein
MDRYPACPAGYEDHWYIHYFEFSVSANQISAKLPLQLDTDSDFRWRATMGSIDHQFQLRFYDPWGNPLESGLLIAELMLSKAAPGVFFPEIICPAGSTPQMDLTEYTGNSGTLKLALLGVKRFVANG